MQRKFLRQIFYQKKDSAGRQYILHKRGQQKPGLRSGQQPEKGQKERVQRFPVNVHCDILFGIVINADAVCRKHPQKKQQ